MKQPDEQRATGAPTYAKEFPIAQAEEFRVNRRSFALMLCSAAAAGVAGFKVLGEQQDAESFASFDACAFEDLPAGTDRIIHPPNSDRAILLVHLPSGDLRAYDQRCTHLLCPVHYDSANEKIVCPCHNGLFNPETGAPAGGPPRKPLPRFEVRVEGGRVFVGKTKPVEKTES